MTQIDQIKRPQNAEEYLDSLDDGREVWIYGEKVEKVTEHPAFRNYARSIARLYDALHDPESAEVLTVPTDTGNGGVTHPFFRVQRSVEDLDRSAQAIQAWQRLGFGWLGRSPDYKAAITSLLGADPEWFGEYADNARAWYKKAQEGVLHIGHAIVNPPVDRDKPLEETKDVYVHVVKETDAGLIVSGAKVVATGCPVTQYCYVSHLGAPVKEKSMALTFMVPMGAPGVKIIARASYEYVAAKAASPFDYPLSSRFDENDAILVFDNVLIPWEDVLIYDTDRINTFTQVSSWGSLAILQSATRLGVKLDFITGLLERALQITGSGEFRGVQAGIGEILNIRHTVYGLRDAMIYRAKPGGLRGSVVPDASYMRAYASYAPGAYRRMREIIETIVASGLIYLNSHAKDFENDELRPYLETYLRGSNGKSAEDRSRVMKALWDAVGSEFGSRHELYELNYFAQPEIHHITSYFAAKGGDQLVEMDALVEKFFSDYDLSGFTASDYV